MGSRSLLALSILLVALAGWSGRAQMPAAAGEAWVFAVEGPIGPATSDYLKRGFARAREEGAALIVLRLDTPGGLDTAMREIIREILASPVPVAAWVGPSGARAASAGTFIVYASHIAAMAPGTNMGAATPVAIGAPGGAPQEPAPEEPEADVESGDGERPPPRRRPGLMDKAMRDAAAYIRSLARMRGRNPDWAERAVVEAASISAEEAVEAGVVELLASDLEELLARIDGREVEVAGRTLVLETEGLELIQVDPDWRARLLAILTNPNVAYILLLIGVYGIILEFYSPGLTGPGLVGAIALLLALYAFQVLPVNYAGLALVALGAGLLVAEAFLGSFGILGIAGIAALALGGIMLFDTEAPGFAVSLWIVGGVAAGGGSLLLALIAMIAKSRRRPVAIGPERMPAERAEVLTWQNGQGTVRFEGEVWQAHGPVPLEPGEQVVVVRRQGLRLEVKPTRRHAPKE